MPDGKEKQKPITTDGEPQEVDYSTLDVAEPESQEVDYSTLAITGEPEKKKEEPTTGVSVSEKEPLQLVSPEEIEKKLTPTSSTIQPIQPVQPQELPQDEESLNKYFELDNNFKELSKYTNIPVENLRNAADILTVKPLSEPLPTGYVGSFMKGLYNGVGGVFNTLAGAHSLVQDALGIPSTVNPFKDIADVYLNQSKETFGNVPEDAMSDFISSVGSIIPDIVVAEYALPEMGSIYLSKLTKGTIKTLPKFAKYLGAKETFNTYQDTENVIESVKEGVKGFEMGAFYQAIGMTSDEIGGIVSKMAANEKLGAFADVAANSLLFGASSMVESGNYDMRTFLSGAGLGLGFSVSKAKRAIENAATKKMFMSYFTSTPEMEKEAMAIKKSNTELRREAIDLRLKAKASQSDMERDQYYSAAARLENYIGIRAVNDIVQFGPEMFIDAIQNDKSLSQNEADHYSKKVMESYMNNNENLKKVKPEIDEINKLARRVDEIDKMEIADAEKDVLKKESEDKIAELQKVIDSKLKIGEQPPAPAEQEGMKKVEPIAGKVTTTTESDIKKEEIVKNEYIPIEKQKEVVEKFTHYKSGDKLLPRTIWADWFLGRSRESKERIAREIEINPELKNSLLSNLYDEYIKETGEKISFDEFLNKEIEVYRGETEGDKKEGEPYGFQTYTFTEQEAKNFSKTGNIIKKKIKPIDTFGSIQTVGAEREIIIPTKYSPKFYKTIWEGFENNNIDFIEKKLTEEQQTQLGNYIDKNDFESAYKYINKIKGEVELTKEPVRQKETKYEVGITTATKGLGEIGKQLDESQRLFDEGKFEEANKIYTDILDQGHKKLADLFNDIPDVEIRLAQTKGTFFRETEPTFEYEIIDKGDNLDLIKERLVNTSEEWNQKNVHISIRMNTLPEGVKIGEELEDGSVHEVDYDINFGEQLSDQQYKDLLTKINDLGLPGANLKNDKKTLNLYNISKFENYEQYETKFDKLYKYLAQNRLGAKVKQGYRKLWVYGRADGGATRSYEEVRSEVRGRKPKEAKVGEEPKNAISTGKETQGLGEEKGSEARIGEVGKNGVRNTPENKQLETRTEPQKEIPEEKPIIVKEGINLFGLTVDDNAIIKLWRENLTSKGYLPKSVFNEWAATQGRVKAELYKANYLVADLRRAMREAYGKTILGTPKISKEERERLNGVLQDMGEGKRYEALQDVPESLHEPLLAIRDHIDALSRELIRSGATEGIMKAVIKENLGYYMTRTYRAHNDKQWKWENIDEAIKNRAISWMRAEYPDYTDEQINGILKEWIYQKDGILGFIQKGKLGSKDLGITMKRKGIPVELRDLLGEYKDPMYNYSTSVSKMANLIEKQKFLEFVKNDGMDKYLFKQPDSEHFVKISAEGNKTMDPLNGLYATPEISKAFETFGKSNPMAPFWRVYMKYLNVPVKYGKTILSPVTHARNYFANYWFHIANGRYFFMKEIPTAHATMWKDLTKKDSKEFRDYMQKLVKYNVIGESTRAGEVHDAIADATRYTEEFDKYGDSLFKKAGRSTLKGAEKLYQVEDDVHKIIAFEYERGRYEKVIRKQNPGKSEEKINDLLDQKAAEIVRKTMATYSLVPKLIKQLRRFPLVGTFVSFPAEVIRTYGNTLQLAVEEMKNADTRDIGIARMSGLMVASIGTAVLSTGIRYLNHVDRQDEIDMKRFVAPWSQNSNLAIIKNKGAGVYSYIDMGFSDPYQYIKKPVNAFFRGEDFEKEALQAMKEMAQPFLGEELVASKIIDITRNVKKGTKDKIFNPESPLGDRLNQSWEYMWGGIQPGVVYQGKRIAKSFSEKANEYGLSPENEFMNLFLGLRTSNLDVNRAFGFKVYRGGTRLNDAQNIYRKVLYDKLAKDEEKQKAIETANKAVEKVIMDLHEDYRAAIRLGVDKKELFTKLDNMNIEKLPAGRKVRTYIMKGEFRGLDERTGKIK